MLFSWNILCSFDFVIFCTFVIKYFDSSYWQHRLFWLAVLSAARAWGDREAGGRGSGAFRCLPSSSSLILFISRCRKQAQAEWSINRHSGGQRGKLLFYYLHFSSLSLCVCSLLCLLLVSVVYLLYIFPQFEWYVSEAHYCCLRLLNPSLNRSWSLVRIKELEEAGLPAVVCFCFVFPLFGDELLWPTCGRGN